MEATDLTNLKTLTNEELEEIKANHKFNTEEYCGADDEIVRRELEAGPTVKLYLSWDFLLEAEPVFDDGEGACAREIGSAVSNRHW